MIPDLLPKTYYMIRARALNLAGGSDSSNIIILQTNSEEAVSELTSSDGRRRHANSQTIVSIFLLSLLTRLSEIRAS